MWNVASVRLGAAKHYIRLYTRYSIANDFRLDHDALMASGSLPMPAGYCHRKSGSLCLSVHLAYACRRPQECFGCSPLVQSFNVISGTDDALYMDLDESQMGH